MIFVFLCIWLALMFSGLLYFGNGLFFIMIWVVVCVKNGYVVFCIDDFDKVCICKFFVEDIFRILEWLGLDYDEGLIGVDYFFFYWL